MIALLAMLAAAAASAQSAPALDSTAPWWEKVTVTIGGDGATQACTYETSLSAAGSKQCEVLGNAKGLSASAGGSKAEYTKITFERRFTPGAPDVDRLQTGDKVLGRQVLALAIDGAGKVDGCRIIASTGDMTPDYGCEEAATERFEASAAKSDGARRQGYMTVLVYGHAAHFV